MANNNNISTDKDDNKIEINNRVNSNNRFNLFWVTK